MKAPPSALARQLTLAPARGLPETAAAGSRPDFGGGIATLAPAQGLPETAAREAEGAACLPPVPRESAAS